MAIRYRARKCESVRIFGVIVRLLPYNTLAPVLLPFGRRISLSPLQREKLHEENRRK